MCSSPTPKFSPMASLRKSPMRFSDRSEGDWDGWAILTQKLGRKVQLVGDDVFVTNTKIFADGIAKKIANAILRSERGRLGRLGNTDAEARTQSATRRRRCVRHQHQNFRRWHR